MWLMCASPCTFVCVYMSVYMCVCVCVCVCVSNDGHKFSRLNCFSVSDVNKKISPMIGWDGASEEVQWWSSVYMWHYHVYTWIPKARFCPWPVLLLLLLQVSDVRAICYHMVNRKMIPHTWPGGMYSIYEESAVLEQKMSRVQLLCWMFRHFLLLLPLRWHKSPI